MITLVIFDPDDTLIPEIDYIKSGFKEVAKYFESNYEFDNAYDELFNLFKKDKKLVFNRYLDAKGIKYSQDDIHKIVDIYKTHVPDVDFYPDVMPTVSYLKMNGIKGAIVTDGTYKIQKLKTDVVNAKDYFDTIIYTDELGKEFWKPNPKAFELLKENYDFDYSQMIYVGDNPQKDFYISEIYPIHTVRVMRDDAIYEKEKYLDDVEEEYRINDFSDLWSIIEDLQETTD